MKIDTDLRLAIKSAEKAQPPFGYDERIAAEQAAIEKFLSTHQAAKKQIAKLRASEERAEKVAQESRKALCNLYGLRVSDGKLRFANCGDGSAAFVKAGGKIEAKPGQRWTYDQAMRELAAADEKQGKALLKKYGINWI